MRIDSHWTSCKAAYIHTHYWFLCFYWFLRLFFGLFGLCLHRCLCGLPNCSSFFSGLWFHGQHFGLLRHHNFLPFSYLCAPPGPPEQLSCKNGRASLSEKKRMTWNHQKMFPFVTFFFFKWMYEWQQTKALGSTPLLLAREESWVPALEETAGLIVVCLWGTESKDRESDCESEVEQGSWLSIDSLVLCLSISGGKISQPFRDVWVDPDFFNPM